ncbi:dienelactone hydrolase family protein [Nisaea acidiphila]|uniref:Dienelactone hydrolase family protein n=1 Tax=Nisaea acidiphila TaxID=1862145 RepID=A0A9J7AXW2_9PROT|nr:dienelactone hydrolase family protein [Nisaea acidiphila]UUX51273.1 dienelactone hydrolase family protein [Nisaea acidiphila]
MGEFIQLTASDGHKFDAYLAQPSGKAKGGVVIVQEIFGINAHIRSVADDYASEGYLAVAPALFDRIEPKIELGYEAEDIEKGRDYKGRCSDDAALLDIAAAQGTAAAAGKVGVVGYCWGGYLAWLSTTRLDGFDAGASYYGGGIGSVATEKPKCPVIFHFGENDHAIPMEDVEKVKAAHPELAVNLYPAGHGFNCDHRGSYDATSAKIARERTLELFGDKIG